LEISPDKQFIAAAGNPVVRLYEICNSEARLTLEGHKNNVTALGFQKEGSFIYTSSEDGTIKLWDLRCSSYSRSWDVGAPCHSVCLRTDRDELISGDQNGNVKIWDLGNDADDQRGCIHSVQPSTSTTTMLATNDGGGPVSAAHGTSTGSSVETTGGGSSLFDNNDSNNNSNNNNNNNSNSHHLPNDVMPNTDHHNIDIAAGARPSSLDIKGGRLDMLRRRKRRVGAEEPIHIQAVDISDDSRTLVALTNHGWTFVWDPTRLVHNDQDGHTFLRPVTQYRAHEAGVYGLRAKISPDSRHLVTTGSDGAAKLWDTTTWHQTQLLQQPKWVWDAAFCADSSYLVTSSSDHVARLWNLRDGEVVRSFFGHSSPVTCVALNDCSE
jgi:WD40 repeat protein